MDYTFIDKKIPYIYCWKCGVDLRRQTPIKVEY